MGNLFPFLSPGGAFSWWALFGFLLLVILAMVAVRFLPAKARKAIEG